MRQVLVLISTENQRAMTSLDELLQHQTHLEPEEVVLVFQQFFILDTLTFYSDDILVYLYDKYVEEFK